VVLFEVPKIDSKIRPGDKVVIETDHCLFSQTRFGVRVESIPIVNNDGVHSSVEKSGGVFLEAGMNPIHLEWFNGPAEFVLNLDFEGPNVARQQIPSSRLWHAVTDKDGAQEFRPGLDFKAYEGVGWPKMPDFELLNSTAAGIATNFSPIYRTRDNNCGLIFHGFVQIDTPGIYKFYLKSDDGSRLYVREAAVTCKRVEGERNSQPVSESFEQALTDRDRNHWVQMAGEVTFASQEKQNLNLELMVGGNRVPVMAGECGKWSNTNLLHRWIQVEGICKFSTDAQEKKLVGVFVPGADQIKLRNIGNDERSESPSTLLTSLAEVRHLTTTEAGRQIPTKVRGVVIFTGPAAIVLQDSSDGVFISRRSGFWERQPVVGEVWEIKGSTASGLFSPVIAADEATFIGHAPLPEPIHPTRDQLMNGNMDAEYGELRGVITSVASNEIVLLTPDGQVSVVGNIERPLPELPKAFLDNNSPVGSVVRIRGCFAPLVDVETRQVISGKTYLYPALVEVEDPVPKDPYLLPAQTPADLMWFNVRAVALQRTKLAGQILYSLPQEYLVFDGKNGFRVLTKDRSMNAGDVIEAVGFPNLDGPSPVLQEAQIRKTGRAPLPAPKRVLPEQLLDRALDSRLIEVTAQLLSDTVHQKERVLELQSGPQLFVARVESISERVVPLSIGCRVKLTGVYIRASDNRDFSGPHSSPFDLLLNSSADIVVLRRPPWWTIRRVVMVLGALSAALGIMFVWVAVLRRKVEQRTVQLKNEIEQRQLVEQRHVIESERTRVARDLHDELGAGLTEVGLLGSLANTSAVDTDSRNRYLNQITQTARSLVTSLDEIVWAVNPHYDSVGSLVSYFSLYAESFLSLAAISCRLRVPEKMFDSPLDSKQRHDVFCVFREALNNVVRHSRASEVKIIFETTAESLSLSVVDNGCGFEFVPDSPGKDGLAGIRQRIQELEGICEINSQLGLGTTVKICLPLNQNQHGQSRDS